MRKYSILVLVVAFAGLVGCNLRPAPSMIKCGEGYNPYYRSTSSSVEFKCVKNET